MRLKKTFGDRIQGTAGEDAEIDLLELITEIASSSRASRQLYLLQHRI
jgi:hypothetical protein